MSALALLLQERGHTVSGSDVHVTPMTEHLRRAGVAITIGHEADTVRGVDLVTFSPAVREINVELAAARAGSGTVARRGEVLGSVVASRRTLGVAGTHGKTTTSSMLASIALHGVKDPSYLIGEPLAATGVNAHWGDDDLLVLEADESYGTFTFLSPAIVGITNVEADHLDYYGTEAALIAAFASLLARATSAAVVWADDQQAAAVGLAAGAQMVGTSPSCHYVVTNLQLSKHGAAFRLLRPHGAPLDLNLLVGGMHNVANAALAAAMADLAGLSGEAITSGLAAFSGVARRYEFRGEVHGIRMIDDYAHLPSEVAATVSAAAESGFSSLVVIFQPHRYTRMANVGHTFGTSFNGADFVIVTPIYAAGEDPIASVSSEIVSNVVREHGSVAKVIDVGSLAEAAEVAARVAINGSLILTLGAGDSTTLPELLRPLLEQK